MKIFAFEKSYLERINDFSVVLEEEDGTSIRDQWKDFLETSM